jgi:hypothetical protein
MYYNIDNAIHGLAVVGSANNNNCTTIIANQNTYGVYGYFANGSKIWDLTFPDTIVNTSFVFSLEGMGSLDKDSSELPLCGVTSPSNFKLVIHSTWNTQKGAGTFGRKLPSYFMIFLFN